MDEIVRFLSSKISQKKEGFFYTSLDAISSFVNIDGYVTFLLYDLEIEC